MGWPRQDSTRQSQAIGTEIYVSLPNRRGSYRPPRFNLSQIKLWLRHCRDTHGDCCNDRYSEALSSHLQTIILVDVDAHSLVVLPSTTPYIALSYVWGQVPLLKTASPALQLCSFAALQLCSSLEPYLTKLSQGCYLERFVMQSV
jgi:hypothetical protein